VGGGGYETNYLTFGGGGYETNYDICGGGGTKQKMSGILCLYD
jgi:hypothetical protein